MATAVFGQTDAEFALPLAEVDDRHGWGMGLLLALVATLFVRPADLIPALADWPIYQYLIVCCLVVSARAVSRQLGHRKLREQPVTVCLLVLLLAVGVSHLSHGFLWGARMSMVEVSKLLALYLLIIGLVNTPRRMLLFVKWLILAITVVALLALLDRYQIIPVAALESIRDRGVAAAGQGIVVERIRGTGIFNDPNDFGLILVTGLILCMAFLVRPSAGWPRYVWLVPTGILLSTVTLTHSRGALLSLLCAVPAGLSYIRGGKFGGWLLLGLPLLALVFSGRMADVSAVNEGTGQDRIQIWSDSLAIWRQYPLFGLGEGLIVDEIGMVTHNSFLHCYAELGLFGGTAFLACFLAAGLGMWPMRNADLDPTRRHFNQTMQELTHLNGYVFTALLAAVAGMLTISRQFVAPAYIMLGLAATAQALADPRIPRWHIGNRFLLIALIGSIGSLLAFYLTVRIFVRW